MKPSLFAVAFVAIFSVNAVQAQPSQPAPPNPCSTKNKSALRAQLLKTPAADDAWSLTEVLLCGAKTPVNAAYLRRHMPPKIKVTSLDTDGKDEVSIAKVDAALIDSLFATGVANETELNISEDEIILRYWPNEACMNSRTLRYGKGTWRLAAIGDACD
ncbi:hypothetical protein D0T25_13140 [Duganella sp. BJB488]|uniref:hypothetical protein n=1 Tax=Duganella sp. BJB489 TaxID=1871351 RepID=UPI000E347BDA|nr:hypothetical protein [Duganella sp. BJB489]RFP17693.1 hypothetical protein D0T26_15885 [Duganella sp. BJB489]RFP22202.1 hypothetical protein D0T25_13140 [Duganella sp. BJB488]RFP37537.1 hypothetical protein D0T24_05985 [Duganella sp. BJB480]